MKTPKQRFLDSTEASPFANIVTSTTFIAAVDAARLQFISELPSLSDGNVAAANAYRIDGAWRFLATLAGLPIAASVGSNLPKFRDNLEP